MACPSPSGSDKKPPKAKTGFECDFVEQPQKQFQSECPICLQILREPHLIVSCGHNFCAACIGRIEDDGKPCPLCKTSPITHVANLGLKRALNEFRVYCPHCLCGCEWEDELGKLDEHLNSDPQPQCQLEGCLFAVIECLHCKEGIRRDKIAGHQLEHCPQRPHTCEYCTEYKSTFQDVTLNHWPECEYFLLPCPNECTSSIQRQHLDQHVIEECPLTVVHCELHHAGCEVMLPRKDMAVHIKEDSITHISLLVDENCHLTKQLVVYDEQICQVTRLNTVLQETNTKQLRYLREKANSQLQEHTAVHTETKQMLTQTKQELARTKKVLARTKRELARSKQEPTRTKQWRFILVAILLVFLLVIMHKVTSQSPEVTRVKQLNEAEEQAIDQLQTQQQYNVRERRTNTEMPYFVNVKDTSWFSHPSCRITHLNPNKRQGDNYIPANHHC